MRGPGPGGAVVRDATTGAWLRFSRPFERLVARRLEDVVPVIREVERQAEDAGAWAAGFLSYEAGPAFDRAIVARAVSPGVPLAWFGLYRSAEEVVLPAVDPDPADWDRPWTPSIDADAYRSAVRRIRERIRAGDTYQVNFTYRLRARFEADPWRWFLQLVTGRRPRYGAFVDTGDLVAASASPELFLRLDGDRIVSRPMKGTAPRAPEFQADRSAGRALRVSEKDRAENVMIVDMVRNDLGRVTRTGSVETTRLFTLERHDTVWQLTSSVRGRTDAPFAALLGATFPPASITGAPKARTTEIIAELEDSPRGLYTGSIGFVGPGRRVQLNVAIRTLVVDRNAGKAEYGTGGGIVWDSREDSELRETGHKARALSLPPPRFRLLETLAWMPPGRLVLPVRHLRRLRRSAAYFGFPCEPDRWRAQLEAATADLPAMPHRLRLLLDRDGRCQVEREPLTRGPGGSCAGSTAERRGLPELPLAAAPVDPADPFLYHKTTNRRVYEDALSARPGHEDVLLFNPSGEITESTIANVVVERDRELVTPPVSAGLLPGTARAALLAAGRIREAPVSADEILGEPRVWLINSVQGARRVRVVESR